MSKMKFLKSALVGGTSVFALAASAHAAVFDIPGGDLATALDSFSKQTGVALLVSGEAVKGARTHGAHGDLSADVALARILNGTGFTEHRDPSGLVGIERMAPANSPDAVPVTRVAETTPAHAAAGIESVVVTSSKIKGDIQTVPIAITALSQEQLTSRQIAGGPDLVKEVPNLTFTKTNFSGYSIQIRGIGTQAISVTTDPAVAVAFNDMPFIRNHFFEQEFYDVNQVEVLRGPQGTLYGRNATAGVVNVISAKPTDQFEAMASADIGNYHNRRFEGMINIPIVDDRVDLRIAGEWTMRDGYSFNAITNRPIDGRDLWSSRVTLGLKPTANLQATLIWEHFGENDDRMRSAKQLCKTDVAPTSINGTPVSPGSLDRDAGALHLGADYLSQGCIPSSLYSPDAFEVPYGFSLPYAVALGVTSDANRSLDPYASTTQSRNLRVIESTLNPHYAAKNDVVELNADYAVTPSLTFTSQTGFNQDFLSSTEDYNRFNTSPGIFLNSGFPSNARQELTPDPSGIGYCVGVQGSCLAIGDHCTPGLASTASCGATSIFCDPQLGCANRLVAEDLSNEHAWQLSQEFRLGSNFSGPLNFSIGGNYLHYETEENYYVFINALTIFSVSQSLGGNGLPYVPGVSDNSDCILTGLGHNYDGGWQNPNPVLGGGTPTQSCVYIDPNPITNLNNHGHNYFLSQNPYTLNSYAGFGEANYNLTNDLKLIGGVRFTVDQKHFTDIPSEVLTNGFGYPITGVVNQQWDKFTGRGAVNWTPKLDFTDQTLIYGSYARGYKAGGANPPGAIFSGLGGAGSGGSNVVDPIHPLIFQPEYIDAFELGSKNTLLDGALTLNGDIFYYNYKGYQISRIVDRTAINDNFDAKVKGAELETSWEPAPGLKFSFAGGYEDTRINNGQSSIDLIDRTDAANHPGWMVVKPFVTAASNCILPTYLVQALLEEQNPSGIPGTIKNAGAQFACFQAYGEHLDPATGSSYVPKPQGTGGLSGFPIPAGYPGFDPLGVDPTAPANVNNGLGLPPNNGEGFSKQLGGNQLPNAPHFTTSLSAEYTLPVSEDWAATLHSDFYWQSQSFARVFNDRPYDKIRGYSNVNLALILTSASGWQVLGYLKNVFNTTAITGDFLNSDDSGLTTNVFLTDPRLYGVRVTKNF